MEQTERSGPFGPGLLMLCSNPNPSVRPMRRNLTASRLMKINQVDASPRDSNSAQVPVMTVARNQQGRDPAHCFRVHIGAAVQKQPAITPGPVRCPCRGWSRSCRPQSRRPGIDSSSTNPG